MPSIFNIGDLAFTLRKAGLPEFEWHTSERLSQVAQSKRLVFDIRSLDPKRFSFPFHFHRNAEEMFFIISGACTLRTADGFQTLAAGTLVHFEEGPGGAHQLYNHGDAPCVYLDIRTFDGFDVTEYPDSGKVGFFPAQEVFAKGPPRGYYDGEGKMEEIWPADILGT